MTSGLAINETEWTSRQMFPRCRGTHHHAEVNWDQAALRSAAWNQRISGLLVHGFSRDLVAFRSSSRCSRPAPGLRLSTCALRCSATISGKYDSATSAGDFTFIIRQLDAGPVTSPGRTSAGLRLPPGAGNPQDVLHFHRHRDGACLG